MNQPILTGENYQGVNKSLRECLGVSFAPYQLREAATGEAAVAMAQAVSPGPVIRDIGLPWMWGVEATQAMTKLASSTQAVRLTMLEDADYRQHAAGTGAQVAKGNIKTNILPTIKRPPEGNMGEASRG